MPPLLLYLQFLQRDILQTVRKKKGKITLLLNIPIDKSVYLFCPVQE